MKKALIAMSGGVDSSVAAYEMLQAGYECIGAMMRLYTDGACGYEAETAPVKTCCSPDDVEDARRVAGRLRIPFHVFRFTEPFREQVMQRFADDYRAGLTPNPCIDCNRYLKFGLFLERAKELGCDTVVTGHYARIGRDEESGRYLLLRAADPAKDQSYVLYNLTQEQLAHIAFPLGGFSKNEVRRIAQENGFVNAKKQDSQDICFVPDGDYASFIERFTGRGDAPGHFVSRKGEVLGEHKGLIRYTIGQRRGLGIAYSSPLYVCGKDPNKNEVILGSNEELFSRTLTAREVNWIAYPEPATPIRAMAKIRYRHTPQWARVTPLPGGRMEVVFDEPQRAITGGQAVVLYDGDVVIGGGRIEEDMRL